MNRETKNKTQAFNRDAINNSGYLYTTNAQLSSHLANLHLSDITLEIVDFSGKKVLDIGCGDGTYTIELFDRGQPSSIIGIDPAQAAIEIAKQKIENRSIEFVVENAYELSYSDNSFDIAYLRGVLHHMDQPIDALREALRVAPIIVVIEPNGYNPILKLLERFSRYHIEHNEKSYAPDTLNRWVKGIGGNIETKMFAGLVPYFCPDWLTRILKVIEPVVEKLPVINALGCAVYIFSATHEVLGENKS